MRTDDTKFWYRTLSKIKDYHSMAEFIFGLLLLSLSMGIQKCRYFIDAYQSINSFICQFYKN